GNSYLTNIVNAAALWKNPADATDYRIVTAGWTDVGGYQVHVTRASLPSLLADSSFDGDGYTFLDLGAGHDVGYSIVSAPDGKIVVGAYSEGVFGANAL